MNKQANTFEEVVEAHKGIIYTVAQSYCRSASDREDLVQEITVQLWRSFAKYDDRYKYSTWIYRIALNVAISFYRKESKRRVIAHPIPEAVFNIAETDDTTTTAQQVGLLQQFIAELKELDKALILLYLDGRGHKEIADIMGISETNVSTKVGRIKEKLKQRFAAVSE